MAVDLVRTEYGSTHDEVLDTPVCLLRQQVANIDRRKKTERLRETTIAEWQTRTLAQFIAATVDTGKKRNPLADEAAKIRLRMEDDKGKADSDVPMEVYIEEGSQVAHNSPAAMDRLMAGFGG